MLIASFAGAEFAALDSSADGMWSWQTDPRISVEKRSYTWNNSSIGGSGSSSYTHDAYVLDTRGAWATYGETLTLQEGQALVKFGADTPDGTEYKGWSAVTSGPIINNTYYVRLTDADSPRKVLTFKFKLGWAMGGGYMAYFGVQYEGGNGTRISLDFDNDNEIEYHGRETVGINFGNRNDETYVTMPSITYQAQNVFWYENNVPVPAAGWDWSGLTAALASDNFGQNGVKLAVNSGEGNPNTGTIAMVVTAIGGTEVSLGA